MEEDYVLIASIDRQMLSDVFSLECPSHTDVLQATENMSKHKLNSKLDSM